MATLSSSLCIYAVFVWTVDDSGLITCLSFLSTQGNKRQTPTGLEVILAWNIIHNILVSRQTTVVKVTNPTPIQTILSVAGIVGMQSICGNVVRAAGTYGSQMTGVSKPARGTEMRHSKYLHDVANHSTCLIQVRQGYCDDNRKLGVVPLRTENFIPFLLSEWNTTDMLAALPITDTMVQ